MTDKLDSQIHFLHLLCKDELQSFIDSLGNYKERVASQKSKRDLLRIEAGAGHLHFRNYVRLYNPKYGFVSRHSGGIKTGNRYASGVINALLNYGYSVLAAEIAKFVHGLGLDPYCGFYHKKDTSFQALIYDLIEPFRWMVEDAVYKLASDTNHNRPIRKSEYAWTRGQNNT